MTEKKEKEKKEKKEASFNIGSLGGFFKGLERLVDLSGKITEKGGEIREEGQIKGLGKDVRGVYGFSIRTLAGGKPVVEHFGNIKETPEGMRMDEEREPIVDIFDEKDYLLLVVEMPGVEKSDVEIKIKGDRLTLKAQRGERKYFKDVFLPAAVDESTRVFSYKNGMLEIKLAKRN